MARQGNGFEDKDHYSYDKRLLNWQSLLFKLFVFGFFNVSQHAPRGYRSIILGKAVLYIPRTYLENLRISLLAIGRELPFAVTDCVEMDSAMDSRKLDMQAIFLFTGLRAVPQCPLAHCHEYRSVLGHLGPNVFRPESRSANSHHDSTRMAPRHCLRGSSGRSP